MERLTKLRDKNIVAVPYLDVNKKFKNQIEFADKINADYSLIIGDSEREAGVLTVKDMKSGEQQTLKLADAIKLLKQGKKVQREGWNGKNQYIELATCISYMNADEKIINAEHEAIGNKAIAFVGTSGVQLGWLASQADILAEDWKIVE